MTSPLGSLQGEGTCFLGEGFRDGFGGKRKVPRSSCRKESRNFAERWLCCLQHTALVPGDTVDG